MKFRFRADPEDLMIFTIFAIFLLYIVSLGVVNLSTFAQEGHLSGLNPFPAFSPKYIASTIVFYILSLIGLFISVSSMFFEREEGFGIVAEQKAKGYSRWAKEKEIKEELQMVEITQKNAKAAGIPLILNDKEMWVDNSEYHSLVIGATGSGKTQTVILPLVHSLAKARESMIITDPKGEIYEKTSNMLRARGYQILLLNFRDPQNGNAWNPMSLPYEIYKSGNQDKAIELLDDLALNILYDDSNKNSDPFWEKTSADYFSGVALGLFEDAKPEEININSISLATTIGEEKMGGSTYIKEYFSMKDPSSAAAINASSTIMAPSETKGSILSVFKQKVKLFASRENLSEMLSHSDIDLKSIGERPTAVFIVIQDEKKTYHSLVTILLKQIYETLISVAQTHGGKLPVRTNFLLDEFANMPPLKDVTTMITAARSRAIRFTMIIQNFAQLDSVYGKEDAETIRGNCGNIVYLITTELKALEEISKMCGEVKSKQEEKTSSTPLVTVSDLQRMKQFEVIILRMRKQPFKTRFTPFFKLKWGKNYPPAKYPTRPKKELKTFDIKEFVKNQKRKKLLNMMESSDEEVRKGLPPELQRPTPSRPTSGSNEQVKLPDFLKKDNEASKSSDPFRDAPGLFGGAHPFGPDMDKKDSSFSVPKFNIPDDAGFQPFGPGPKQEEKPSSPSPSPLPSFANNDDDDDDDLGFDVDEIVKKIDAKIAELEAEEKKEKEAEEKKKQEEQRKQEEEKKKQEEQKEAKEEKPTNSIQDVFKIQDNEPLNVQKLDEFKEVKTEEKQEKPFEPRPQVTLKLDEDDGDDDDFFDDFFDN